MKKYLAAAIATLLLAGTAYAQAPATPPAPSSPPAASLGAGAGASFTLAPADMTKLQAWLTTQQVASVAAPAGFTVAVGSTLPATIMLHAIPASAGVTAVGSNEFAVIDGQTVLVSPTDRKIVYVLG